VTPHRLRAAAVASALLVVAVAINAGAAGRPATPPPTPVPPHGSPSPFPTRLATPADTDVPPTIAAGAALLADPATGQILFAKDPRTRRPIASITKLMTALLARRDLPLHGTVTVDADAVFDRHAFGATSVLGLDAGERISVENLLYVSLIIFFAYFYTAIIFNPDDVAENMRKYGGFIPGIRPGKRTAEYIDTILTRITLVGALYLAVIAILPEFLISGFKVAPIPLIGEKLDQFLPRFITEGMNITFYFGGTSLLIIVGVAMDTVQQVESQLIMRHYDGFMKKTRIRGRRGGQ